MPKYLVELAMLTRSTALVVVESETPPEQDDLREAYLRYDEDIWNDDPDYCEMGTHRLVSKIEDGKVEGFKDVDRIQVVNLVPLTPIPDLAAFCNHLGIAGTEIETARKRVFKDTECGAGLHYRRDDAGTVTGIEIGSIVEGVDQETEYVALDFPFTTADWDEAVAHVEDEAKRIWDETHGCEQCGPEDEGGYRRINPECPACKGAGIVF